MSIACARCSPCFRRQVKGNGAGAAHAPDLTNADLGVVSFKFSNTPASPQAANQVRGARQASLPAPGLRRGARIGARCGSSA
jgi:hypothetical protein